MRLKPDAQLPGLKQSLGDELLRTHTNYQPLLARLPPAQFTASRTSPAAD